MPQTLQETLPDERGRFGQFGGKFVPETLMGAIHELEVEYRAAQADEEFQDRLQLLSRDYVGRPTKLYYAENLTRDLGGARIYIKREDLAHTGAHKINNALGQGLLAQRMGKHRIIAETGAGQHGVATATVCSMLGQECIVYMGEEDIRRQALNVFRMRLLGAEVRSVTSGSRTLKDAINETIRDWVTNVETTHYTIGSVVGPHPYPMMVRDFQAVIGREAREQLLSTSRKTARLCRRLHRRRIQRDGPVLRVREGRRREARRSGGRGAWNRDRGALIHTGCRTSRRAARQHVVPAPGRRRPGPRGA